jgi:hypothetical protein
MISAERFSKFINRLIAVENEARMLGMFETMHAINAAKNKAGFERAYLLEKSEKNNRAASRGAMNAHAGITTGNV